MRVPRLTTSQQARGVRWSWPGQDVGTRRFTTRVHDEGSRRGFTRRFTTGVQARVHRCDTVRAERAGWLGATSELRDGVSLKNGLVAAPIVAGQASSQAYGRPRCPTDWARTIGSAKPATRRQHAPRRGLFPRSEAGFTTRVPTQVRDEGSGRRFRTRVHRCDTVRAERAGWLGATSELRDGDSLKTASERVPIVAGQASSQAYGKPRCPTDWARTTGSAKPATSS